MRSTTITPGTPGTHFVPPLGALALAALVGAVVVTVLNVSGIWTSDLAGTLQFVLFPVAVLQAVALVVARSAGALLRGRRLTQQQKLALALLAALIAVMLFPLAASWGYGWVIPLAVLLAAAVFFGPQVARRLAGGPAPAVSPVPTPAVPLASTGRMRLARVCSVLALVSLAGGSALLAVGSIVTEDAEGRLWGILFLWPPTFVISWAFGTAAFWAKGTLNPVVAVLTFLVGFWGGWFALIPVMAVRGAAAVVLPALLVVAIYYARGWFWSGRFGGGEGRGR